MPLPLAPLGMLYGALARGRLRLYRAGFIKSESAEAPVVSVGNLTTGGTGKTPLVEWVARALAREGLRVCVLTRGYGRADESKRVLASDGARVLAQAPECGDEPRLLAERLLGAASVVCDRDRVAAARWAREELRAEVFVLDDGFQHLRLRRDLDIVTVDATDPWGGGRLLPWGRLREPVSGLARAGCVVITRAELASNLEALREKVLSLSEGRAEVFTSRLCTRGLARVGGIEFEGRADATLTLDVEAVGKRVAAFCAVGNPRAFFEHVRREGFKLCYERAFADHHAYTKSDAETVSCEAVRRGARALLTTAKDAVKLRGFEFALPCYVVETEVVLDEEARLLGLLRASVSGSG